jgi:predicted nucleic acid-binding Zn ribbon protein
MVHFYRCDQCGHVWSVLKSSPDGPTTDVTVKPPKP